MTSYHSFAYAECFVWWLYQASMVGHKYGVLRWSKTGSTFFISLSCVMLYLLCKTNFSLLTHVNFFLPEKTIEGTAAGITSVLAACFVLLPLLAATGYIFTMVSLSLSHSHTWVYMSCSLCFHALLFVLLVQHWFSLIVAVTTSGLLEAYTAQLDNAFIPLVFYSMLCL